MNPNEYQDPAYAQAYLAKADSIPHRAEGEAVLLSFLPSSAKRILDLGTGDGRLLALVRRHCPSAELIGVDYSATMLVAAQARFAADRRVQIREHDLNQPLTLDALFHLAVDNPINAPINAPYDAIVSSFAIHHCSDERKRALYAEIFELLTPGGVFCNLEHVSSPTEALHERFLNEMGAKPGEEDPGNILLDVATQLDWLREIGFTDVDCYWKWLELALFGGVRPG